MQILLTTFAICLGLTILLEISFALFAGIRGRRNLLLVIAAQILTNPAAVFCIIQARIHLNWPIIAQELPIEALVVIVEWIFYRKYLTGVKRPFSFSLAANYFSYSMGFVLADYGILW